MYGGTLSGEGACGNSSAKVAKIISDDRLGDHPYYIFCESAKFGNKLGLNDLPKLSW